MKVFMLFTGSGPLVILTTHSNIKDPILLNKLSVKGIEKFIAFEIPLELAKARYGGHFNVVQIDLAETDDLRILDYNGERALKLFHFDEMTAETRIEPTDNKQSIVFSIPLLPRCVAALSFQEAGSVVTEQIQCSVARDVFVYIE